MGSLRPALHVAALASQGALTAAGAQEEVVPASEYRALQAQIRELKRLLGKKTLEAEILKEVLERTGSKKLLLRSTQGRAEERQQAASLSSRLRVGPLGSTKIGGIGMAKFGSGQPVRRTEDNRLLAGSGRYTDDIKLPGQAYAYVLRSPHAHALIEDIDLSGARAAPGVVAVFTGKDAQAGGLGTVPCVAPVPNRDGTAMVNPPRPCIAVDRVRHVGDAVAWVVAESLDQARDAAERIQVEYEPIPAVANTLDALKLGAPQIWDEAPGNVVFDWEVGNAAETDEAILSAAHVARLELVNQRVAAAPLEPRSAIGAYDAGEDSYTLYVTSQGVHNLQRILAPFTLQVAPEKLRVLTFDVGGGFGAKFYAYPEYGMVLWASKQVGRPVRWNAGRDEAFVTDAQARDHVTAAELALDADARFLAVRVRTIASLGAYLSQLGPAIPTLAPAGMHVGVYAIPHLHNQVKGVFSNTTPVDAYRGAGQPEACYVIERLIDVAAKGMGIPAPELRRRNFIRTFPFTTPTGTIYDSGSFEQNITDAMDLSGWSSFEARRTEKARKGLLAGIGMAYYVERTGEAPVEYVRIEVGADEVSVIAGTQSTGQGHETAYAQIVAERLGIPFESIRVSSGDTHALQGGHGTGGSRSLTMAGGAIRIASEDIIAQGKPIAASQLEAAEADIEFSDGRFTIVGTDRTISLFDVAQIAAQRDGHSGLAADGVFNHSANTFPNGCHICEIEIDQDTGVLRIVRYTAVNDFGKVLNPVLVAGQVHGGVVQGLGQAMGEMVRFDPQTGQLLTGSFMDYWIPRADDVPFFTLKHNEIPCATNPLGVKGCGEAGTIAACPALVDAVVDALKDHGIRHIDMPITAAKLWDIVRHKVRASGDTIQS